MITLGFRHWPNPVGDRELVFAKLIEHATNDEVEIVDSQHTTPCIQIESVYHRNSPPDFKTRAYRFLASHTPQGIDFSKENYSPNQQPTGKAPYNIFFTGENERPPLGKWDCYLTFDIHSFGGKNAYLPLWWLTSSDLIMPVQSPYLGRAITIDEMIRGRTVDYTKRKKFCAAFIGKAYPFRMQAIAALSKIGKVDVFGGIARNATSKKASEKFDTSQDYKFVFAFENDIYPGYITEKLFEAWATGAIPLYWGIDVVGNLNQNAMINLVNYRSLEEFVQFVAKVSDDSQVWSNIASQPILLTKPSLDHVILLLRDKLSNLVKL